MPKRGKDENSISMDLRTQTLGKKTMVISRECLCRKVCKRIYQIEMPDIYRCEARESQMQEEPGLESTHSTQKAGLLEGVWC